MFSAVLCNHGRISVGTRGPDVTFSGSSDVICPFTFFSLGFAFGKVSKKVTFLTFRVMRFSCCMLHIAKLMLKKILVWYHNF